MKTKRTFQSFLARMAMTLLVALFTATGARATTFITDVMLIGGTKDEVNALKSTYTDQGWTFIDNDLNAGCGSGSDYIYLLYKTDDADNTDNLSFITDFYISDARGSNTDEEVSFNGRTYHLVHYEGGEHFKTVMGNLNSNCGSASDDIHLYYTKEFASGNKAVSEITFDNSEDGAVGKNGGTTAYDLNAGCGSESKYIYMHIDNSKRASWWTISKTDDGCFITGYEGAKDDVIYITIPNTIEDKQVTGFSGMDFTDFSYLETIKFFENTVITKMPSVRELSTFKNVHIIKKNGDLTNAVADNTLPESMTEIGDAFQGCGIEILTLTSVTSIGDDAFNMCSSLTSITIPNSVTSIGIRAFCNCHSLTSITIPNSVTSIGKFAFSDCSNLTSVTIPASVTGIESFAFNYCSNLTSISVDENNSVYDSRNNCNAIIKTSSNTLIFGCKNTIIPNTVTYIENDAFLHCSGLTSVTIPASVTGIGNQAFYGCYSLTSLTIGNSVTSIGEKAFYDCSGLTSLTIPNSVTSIGEYAFHDCSGLVSITIGNSVTSIGEKAFYDCSGLVSITIDADNPNYDSRNNCNAIIETSSNTLMFGCKNTIIPNSVTSIGKNAFHDCSGLISITIPNSVTDIGALAFIGCSGLTSITIPNSVTSIGDHAFHDCSDLTSVTINNSKVKIGTGAFNDVSAVFDFPDDFEYGGYSSLDEFISNTGVTNFQLADKTSVTISDAGVATFYSFRGLDLSEVEGLEAYIAKEYDQTTQRVTMLKVKEVPAYTGLLLVGKTGTYELPYKVSEDIDAVDANLLTGTIDPMTIPSTDGDKTNFVLYATADTKPSFRPLTNGFNLKANRAYLQLPTADLPSESASGNIGIEFVDEVTGIGEISNLKSQTSTPFWYTLDGRRLNGKPTQKGIYVVEGHKVLIEK